MNKSNYNPKTKLGKFMDERLPLMRVMYDLMVSFAVPRNLNYFYTFGGILSLMLISQILTGLVLAMHYVPDITLAFESRERFMRDGQFGWLFGPWHSVGASFFFIAAYIHIARGIYYGSHKAPREAVWILGVLIYFTMMAIAFLGYVLIWGQMSVSAASVITNFFKAIPFIGNGVYEMILGGYSIGQPTLNRFYVLHWLLSFILLFLVALHVWAIHVVGQNNPTGIDLQSQDETVPFTPFAMIKDIFAISVFLIFFAWFLFYMPDYLGSPDNFMEADPLKSSAHIQPEWYFLPFYAMLRAINFDIGFINSTLGGILVLLSSVGVLIFLPWLDKSPIRSARYRPTFKLFYWLLIGDIIMLGWLGTRSSEDIYILWAQIGSAYYFIFFLIIMPFLPRFEKTTPLPTSITADMEARKKRGHSLW